MKKILYIFIIILYSNIVFGQDYNKAAEDAAKELKVSQDNLAKFKAAYISNLKNELNKKVVKPRVQLTTDICDDGGFETKDFSNWGWTMVDNRHSSASAFTYMSTISGIGRIKTSPIATDGLLMICNSTARHANSSWEIISSGTDPLIPILPTTHSGNYALKLGDKPNLLDCADYPWKSAESVQKSITINASNKILKFWYQVVTNDASELANHSGMNAAGFGVRVGSTFLPINPVGPTCSNSPILAYSNPCLTSVTVTPASGLVLNNTTVSYLPWTCANVDLSAYIGQTITIEFMVFDCIHTGHFAYAYIDDICMGCDGNTTPQTTTPTNPCCKNTLSMVTPLPVPPSYPYTDGTYAVEQYNITAPSSAPITEIRVETTSFEWLDGPEDCKQCQIKTSNLGSLFGGISIGGAMSGPTSQPYGNGTSPNANNNEVVFDFPIPKSLSVGDFIKLTYVLPPDKELSCCHTKAKVCRKISWKDTNCNYCEVFDCSIIDLKAKSTLASGFPMPNLLMLYLNSRGIYSTGHAKGY